jgi:hypothetical protein
VTLLGAADGMGVARELRQAADTFHSIDHASMVRLGGPPGSPDV